MKNGFLDDDATQMYELQVNYGLASFLGVLIVCNWLLKSDIVNKVSGLRDPGIQGSIPGARKLPQSRDFPGPGNPGIKH